MPASFLEPLVIAALITTLGWVIGFGSLLAMFVLAVRRTPAKFRAAIIRALAELARAMCLWTAAMICISAAMAIGSVLFTWRQELAGESTNTWVWIERASWVFGIVSGLLALVTLRHFANPGTAAENVEDKSEQPLLPRVARQRQVTGFGVRARGAISELPGRDGAAGSSSPESPASRDRDR
ncbi:hypothetical protein [Actinoplanes solisilvae]|uniref:hypothetical protein n=1 Tax=Actinoplanes solisilvae TaxID=2486853 RepID=UPI000FDAA484|nr:hypothetical protein [Actinoplanes solisilvae]